MKDTHTEKSEKTANISELWKIIETVLNNWVSLTNTYTMILPFDVLIYICTEEFKKSPCVKGSG